MQPVKPKLTIPGDKEDKIMWEAGYIVGFHVHKWPLKRSFKIVWRFGFLPNTAQAKAYGVSVDKPIWIISDGKGNIEGTFTGFKKDLPTEFCHILEEEGVFFKMEKEKK